MSALVLDSLIHQATRASGAEITGISHKIICEFDASKQRWLDAIDVFNDCVKIPDIGMFANERAQDWKTKAWMDLNVPLHLLDAGFSCKDLSSLSGNQTKMVPYILDALRRLDLSTMELPADIKLEGTTLPTLIGVFHCIRKTQPWIIFLENVVSGKDHKTHDT